MSKIGYGYGSEWHLLRYLGYHRKFFNSAIETAIPGSAVVEWLDLGFSAPKANASPRLYDSECRAAGFLPRDHPARTEYRQFWPQSGNVPNWDAVGRIRIGEEDQWLLVEAKSYVGELRTNCTASDAGGLQQICNAFSVVRQSLDLLPAGPGNWLTPYYQCCNRIATAHFFRQQHVPTRLLFLYFLGDCFPRGTPDCPAAGQTWLTALDAMQQHIGWNAAVAEHVHKLFLPVSWEGVCNAPCPTANCNGRCVNKTGHAQQHHFCQTGLHQW